MWMLSSEFFLGVTTISSHYSVASVTGAMMSCLCSSSNSAFSLLRYTKGIVCGVLTWNAELDLGDALGAEAPPLQRF